jgi:hypothetical protein
MSQPTTLEPTAPVARTRRVPTGALVPLAAAVWWVGGYLPWLVAGLSARGGSGDAPRLALPLTTGTLALLVIGALVGGVLAGLLQLVARSGPRWGIAAALGGVILAMAITAIQTTSALRAHASRGFDADGRVLAGLGLALALSALAGWALGAASALGRPGLGLALSVLAGAFPHWLSSLVFAASPGTTLPELGRWLGLAILAAALAVIGIRPASRLLWWPLAIVVAWLTAPALTAVGYLEQLLGPGRGLNARRVIDAINASIDVFGQASGLDMRPNVPWVAAIAVGAALAAVINRRTGVPPVSNHDQLEEGTSGQQLRRGA